jgi:HK97 family phage portal protein
LAGAVGKGVNLKYPNWIKRLLPGSEVKSVGTSISIRTGSFLEWALLGLGQVTATQAMRFYQDTAAIATAVDMIAESFEQIQPVIQLPDGSFSKDDPVLELLKSPNGFDTWHQFAGQLSRHYLLTHNSHMSALGTVTLPPIELYSLKPQNLTVMENFRDSYPDRYMVTQGIGKGTYDRNRKGVGIVRFFDGNLKELYHIMGFSSRSNNTHGDSPLNSAALEAQQLIEGNTHNLTMLKKGGRLSLIVSFKEEGRISDDQHQERKKRINEDLAGSGNAGGIAVLSGPEVNIKEAGVSNKDMDYAKLRELASLAVYSRYKIPLSLVTIKASTFNNLETGIVFLYDNAVLPLADVLFSGLSVMLLPRYGRDPAKERITYDPESITALMDRRLNQIKIRKEIAVETANELRELLPGRQPLGPEADILYQDANKIPLGTDIEEG